jgi:hypothetical protein
MTSGFSRKMGISGEEKAESKREPTHDLEPDAEGPGLAGVVRRSAEG